MICLDNYYELSLPYSHSTANLMQFTVINKYYYKMPNEPHYIILKPNYEYIYCFPFAISLITYTCWSRNL